MKLKPVLFAVACTCAVLSAPASAMGVVDVGTTATATSNPPTSRPQAQAKPPASDQGTGAPALIIAAMVLAAFSIGRRMR